MRVSLLQSAHDLPESDWQSLQTHDDPFISRAFLGIAENTGAASPAQHWQAMHLALHDDAKPEESTLLGLLPLYLRHHSFGDFSHDWNWAPAWQQAG
jgi:predicted N-acyltransferase